MSAPRALAARLWGPAFVLALLAGVGSLLLQSEQQLVQTRSSHGGLPFAWGAAYDLLQELDMRPARSRAKLAERDPRSAQWVIEPAWREADVPYEVASLERFARKGGRVVVIGAPARVWRALGFAPEVPGAAAQDSGQTEQRADPVASALSDQRLEGPLVGRARSVQLAADALFDPVADGAIALRARAAGGAFVLERPLGAGKIVAVAGADFLTNERLANADDALFLLDLARAYGPVCFDERCHGLLPARSLWFALGPGFVLLAGLAFGALGSSALLRARRWPARAAAEQALPAPTLEVFVGSLAGLYRAPGRREPGAVFRAYRAGYMRRLQRRLFGQREVSQVQFERRVEREARQRGPAGRWLLPGAQPTSLAELIAAVAALERYAAAASGSRAVTPGSRAASRAVTPGSRAASRASTHPERQR